VGGRVRDAAARRKSSGCSGFESFRKNLRRRSGDRLAGIALTWNALQHFYVYFDIAARLGTDWQAVLRSSLQEAAADRGSAEFTDTLRRLIAALHDAHGLAIHGDPGSTPALAWEWIEDQIVVVWADPATGLHPGDAILSLDGKPAHEALQAAEAFTSGATPQWIRDWTLYVMLGLGPKDSLLRLDVQPLDGLARSVTVQRTAPFFGPGSVLMRRAAILPAPLAEVRPGIFYADLSRLDDDDFNAALDRLASARGIIFDLRDHPHVSYSFLQHLTDRPLLSAVSLMPLTTRPDRQDVVWTRFQRFLPPKAPRFHGRIAFLAGGRGFSAIESYLNIVEAYHLGEIVGGPTAGTNGNMIFLNLPGDYMLSWTGLRTLKVDGSPNEGVGVAPTVPAALTRRGVAAGRDDVLEKAIAVVQGSTD
jgi:hypothetical protein